MAGVAKCEALKAVLCVGLGVGGGVSRHETSESVFRWLMYLIRP